MYVCVGCVCALCVLCAGVGMCIVCVMQWYRIHDACGPL